MRRLLLFFIILGPGWLAGCHQRPITTQDIVLSGPGEYVETLDYSRRRKGQALLIWRSNAIVLETYHNGFQPDQGHALMEATGSFMGPLALAAEEDGLIILDDPVSVYLPEFGSDENKQKVTIRHLLDHTSGLESSAELRGPRIRDKYSVAANKRVVLQPGFDFTFDSVHLFVFAAVMEKALEAVGENLLEYLERRILNPSGIRYTDWTTDRSGQPQPGLGASMTARNWAGFGMFVMGIITSESSDGGVNKSGRLLLDGGPVYPPFGLAFWNNRPIPETRKGYPFVLDKTPGRLAENISERMLMAAGSGNQRLYIIPEHDMVIVRFGLPTSDWRDADFLATLPRTSR